MEVALAFSQDDAPATSQELQETQVATQLASQSPDVEDVNAHLFGYLSPCNALSNIHRFDLLESKPNMAYTVGRARTNDIVLPGVKISGTHCTITWDGTARATSVTIRDTSTNGTWVNGDKIRRGTSRIIRDGNEIAFGGVAQTNPADDFRFIYRHLACPPLVDGIYARYDLGAELGRGSFATVVQGIHRETSEWYAVKIIHGSRLRGNANSNVFDREISILESLDHPNICRLKEVFMDAEERESDIFIVLELVQGGDLLDYIVRNQGLLEPIAKHLTRQMCQALSYIHSMGITHRDLKPENVLLTRDNPPNVKIADFGLAKMVDSLTMLRTMCGTPSYLAPEVVNQTNNEGYDNLVDSWSAGVIVFCMMTNTNPFIEDEEADLKSKVTNRTIDWYTLSNTGASNEAQDFIRRLLDYDPQTRMTLTTALEHPWLSGAAEPSNPPSPHNDPQDGVLADVSMHAALPSQDPMDDDKVQCNISIRIATHNSNYQHQMPAPARTPPRARYLPLERRSQVLAREAENTGTDSWLLVNNQDAENVAAGKQAKGTGGGKRKNLRSPLGAIAEDGVPSNKRGRLDDDMDISPVKPRPGKQTKAAVDAQPPLRRSARNPPVKPGRK